MLLIHCPYCEEMREEEEFSPAGQAHIERPLNPEEISDEQWAHYLFFRKNLTRNNFFHNFRTTGINT